MTWQEQLDGIVIDHVFGSNTKWPIAEVRKYISHLEYCEAYDIVILDLDTLQFTLPEDATGVLLHVLTGGKRPNEVSFDPNTRVMQLHWDF